MFLGPDTLVMTNRGVKNVSELFRDYTNEVKLPEILTFDTHFRVMKYKPLLKITQHEDIELYTSKFYDTYMSKMTAMATSKDTEILRYDIVNTKNEPIIGGSYNVYSYLYNNWKAANVEWEPISNLLNHGSIAPNLASGDLVVKFIERKVLVEDFGYKLFSGKKEVKTRKRDSEPEVQDLYEEVPVFVSQSFHFNYNFVFVK